MTCIRTGLVGLLLLLPILVFAQTDRLSEEDVRRQGLYIEANQQRILGNNAKAINIFEGLLIEDAENAALHYELARTYEAVDQLQSAIDAVKNAVSLEPENQWYAVFLGDLYQKTGQDEQAASVYASLVKSHPEKEDFYYKWAYFLVRANKAPQALKVYGTMADKFGLTEELTRRKHTLYLGIGDFKKAEKELVNLVNAFPNNTEYLHLLAGFYEQMQEDGKAKDAYERILEIDPNDSKAAIALTEGVAPAENAVNYLRSLQAVFIKQDVELDVKMVQLIPYIQQIADTGDQQLASAALDLMRILDEVHPKEAKVYAATADIHYYTGNKTEAIRNYELAISEDESVYPVWEQLLMACLEVGELNKLLQLSESALDVYPNQPNLYYLNGLAYFNLDRASEAIPSLQQALIMTGRNLPLRFEVYHLLGQVYTSTGNFTRSEDAFSRAIELSPNNGEVLNNYSYMLAEQGNDLAKAKEMAARANEISPNNASYQHTYGWVLYRLQKYEAAKEWVANAVQAVPDNSTFLEHFGDIHYQLGQPDAAIKYWESAAAIGGGSEFLERKIADGKLYE